jgi:hypothetical protein
MVNGVQMMVYVSLFNVDFPRNAQFFFTLLIGITNCDVLPHTQMSQFFFRIQPTQPFSNQFDAAGYNSKNIIDNLGSFFYYTVTLLAVMLIMVIINISTRTCPK